MDPLLKEGAPGKIVSAVLGPAVQTAASRRRLHISKYYVSSSVGQDKSKLTKIKSIRQGNFRLFKSPLPPIFLPNDYEFRPSRQSPRSSRIPYMILRDKYYDSGTPANVSNRSTRQALDMGM